MKKITLFMFMVMIAMTSLANDNINGDTGRKKIDVSQTIPPKPQMASIYDPCAFYSESTATLSIELDPVYYTQYTIILESAYICVDYYVTSPVVNITVGSLDSVVDIYIQSNDCGSYYGTLNQAAYGKSP